VSGFLGRQNTHTCTQHHARWRLGVRTGLTASLPNVLVQHVLEYRTITLEAGGVDVGQVVGNDRHARLLRIQAGLGNPQ
jgi:hypothetical protein